MYDQEDEPEGYQGVVDCFRGDVEAQERDARARRNIAESLISGHWWVLKDCASHLWTEVQHELTKRVP